MLCLVTCRAAERLDTDLPLLCGELPEAVVVAWDDAAVDWSTFDVVVIRSTWDYHTRRHEFLEWATGVAAVAELWNPLSVIEWNTDKRYLATLSDEGVPIVPTTFLDAAEPIDPALLEGDVVVKPSVGAGSIGVFRSDGDRSSALRHVERLHAVGLTAMIQPYVSAVDDEGETGLVYLGGEFSHAFRKGPILANPVEFEGGLMAVETSEAHVATNRERALGDSVIALLPETAYARVDLLPGPDGPSLLEVELTEPSLFLHHDPGAPARAASAFRNLLP